MKKIIISLFILFLLGGCYNYKELNDYALATGMAIDYENNKYKVSFLISNSPKNSTESDTQFQTVVYSGKGKSIFEAVKNVGLISPKQLYIGHLSVVIVSEEAAKKGLYKSLEFLLTDAQSKKDFFVVLAKDTKAANILKITTPLADFPSQEIADNIESTDDLQASVTAVDFNKLLYQLINKGTNPVLNGIKIIGSIKKGEKQSNLEKSSLNSYIKIDTLGLFKDDKFIDWTTKNESRGINIINNNITEMYINLKCKDGNIVVNTEHIKTEANINKKGNIDINVKGKGILNELTCNINIEDKNEIKKIEKKVNKKVNKLIKEALIKTQENKTDIFSFGMKYKQNYPKNYKNIKDWDEYFSHSKYKVKTNITIEDTGSLQQSIERIANEKNN